MVPITVPAARAEGTDSRYDVLARIDLPSPGRYELRLSVKSEVSDSRGSVYVDVEVPDFRKAPVSLSGIVVNAAGGSPSAPSRLLNDLSPVAPTTERTFGRQDLVSTFMRVYQGDDRLAAVTLKTRILDASSKGVFEKTETLEPARFEDRRSAGILFRVPLQTLSPGVHLLKFEATSGKTTVIREVIFTVK